MNSGHREIIMNRILEKLGDRRLVCPISGPEATWSIHPRTASVYAAENPSEIPIPSVSSQAYPLAVIICEDCGYTILVNLIKLGVASELGIEVVPS